MHKWMIEISQGIDFDVEEYKKDVGVDGVSDSLLYKSGTEILQHRWRFPTLSLHGIEGAFAGVGSKTVIPAKVTGKFSIRCVPSMTPEGVIAAVERHIDQEMGKLNSPNKWALTCPKSSLPWMRDPDCANFSAARRATETVHGRAPDLTREGGSIPITLVLEDVCCVARVFPFFLMAPLIRA